MASANRIRHKLRSRCRRERAYPGLATMKVITLLVNVVRLRFSLVQLPMKLPLEKLMHLDPDLIRVPRK